jgi:hypothetical protein
LWQNNPVTDPPDDRDDQKPKAPPSSAPRLVAAPPEPPVSFEAPPEKSISREIRKDILGPALSGEGELSEPERSIPTRSGEIVAERGDGVMHSRVETAGRAAPGRPSRGAEDAREEGEDAIDVEFALGEADAAVPDGAGEVFDEVPSSARRARLEELERNAYSEEDVGRKSSPRHTPPPESGRQMAPAMEWDPAAPADEATATPRRPFAAAEALVPTAPIERMPEEGVPVASDGTGVAVFTAPPPKFVESFGAVLDATLEL